jgi:hypothetical protein
MNEVQDPKTSSVEVEVKVKKKRGRKPKNHIPEEIKEDIQPHVPKKRGRKPKGGKIIKNTDLDVHKPIVKQNIILHLKCSLNDLNNKDTNIKCDERNTINRIHEIMGSSSSKNNDLNYDNYTEINENKEHVVTNKKLDNSTKHEENTDYKHIQKKLKTLQCLLHTNNISEKKSACFWCTYDFDNSTIYIPKFKINNSYQVYGCFCSPECSVAYLFNENIDASIKFERYQLINYLYCKIYNFTKNIKPAPNPYYILSKYYGNLSIQEYRQIFEHDRLLMIIEKPMTRVMPELHEDSEDMFLTNNTSSSLSTSTYQIKRKTEKKHSKSEILNKKFGIQ